MTGATLRAYTDGERSQLLSNLLTAARKEGVAVEEETPTSFDASLFERLPAGISTRLDELIHGDTTDPDGLVVLEADGEPVLPWRTTAYVEPLTDLISVGVEGFLDDAVVSALLYAAKQALDRAIDLIKPALVVTSYGTIHCENFSREIAHKLDELIGGFNRDLLVVTGWGGPDRLAAIRDTVDPAGVIMEGGTVLYRRESGFDPEPLFVAADPDTRQQRADAPGTYEHPAVEQTRYRWAATVRQLNTELSGGPPVFVSQGNLYGVCVYPNPSVRVLTDLPDPRETYPSTALELQKRLQADSFLGASDTSLRRGADEQTCLVTDGGPDGLYLLEKLNARYRPYQPYRITALDDESVTFELLDQHPDTIRDADYDPVERTDETTTMTTLERVADRAQQEFDAQYGTGDSMSRIVAQTSSIDVFVRRKSEAYTSRLRESLGVSNVGTVRYINRGTDSDDRFVEALESEEDTVQTYAPSGASQALKNAAQREYHDLSDLLSELKGATPQL